MSTNLFTDNPINIEDLLYESDYRQSYLDAQYINHNENYNSFDNNNINGMSSYNTLRKLYRDYHDIRSKGAIYDLSIPDHKKGIEKDPITGFDMKINYLNDFSISSKFNCKESNRFEDSVCDIYPMSSFPFLDENGTYKNMPNERNIYWFNSEIRKRNKREYTTDFFSYNTQVNPLLYTYKFNDNGEIKIMDADNFCKNNLYAKNLSYVLKGNQICLPLWAYVTNVKSNKNDIYDDDNQTVIDYNETFENDYYLLKDDYTKELLYIFQNPRKYFKFKKQNDYIENKHDLIAQDIERKNVNDIVNEEDSRGHLFYDTLLDMVLRRIYDYANNNELSEDDIQKIDKLKDKIKDIKIRNMFEFDGFPLDQYITNNTYFQYNTEAQKSMDLFKDNIGPKLLSIYKYQYNIVFGQYFRLLPYILSPAYKFKIQSPAMNIMYTVFTLMAIKNAYYSNKEEYNQMIDKLYNSINRINEFTNETIFDEFDNIFDSDFLSDNLCKHLENILPVLIQNTTAINWDLSNEADLDEVYNDFVHYHVETKASNIENTDDMNASEDDKKALIVSRAIILLTEFFQKADKIRYFDASTFCIDYTLIDNQEIKKSLKLFSDALMEACYIHMNILGTEVFFNGDVSGHEYMGNIANISRDLLNVDFIEFDETRIAKHNNKLYEESLKNTNNYRNNSFNSYLSTINIYISLAYCINITLDNLSSNIYNVGPYTQSNIKRSQSVWTILKRYAIHMTYINNNSYGIYNDVPIGNNNKVHTQRIMVSQRLKWLTYGLHLRVWFNDAYFFYTNYKKCMIDFQGDIKKAVIYISQLYNNHTANITEDFPLFKNLVQQMCVPMFNVGLAVLPLMGSYGITVNFACFSKYTSKMMYIEQHLLQLLHHGLKDIMLGDSMSSILGEREQCVHSLLNNEKLSFNNINGNFYKLYKYINCAYYYELIILYNLNYLFIKYIKPYFINNKKACLLLSSVIGNSYDTQFFENQKTITCEYYLAAYDCTFGSQLFKDVIFKNEESVNKYMRFIGKLINLYRIDMVNFFTYHQPLDLKMSEYYSKYYGLSLMNSQFVNKYKKGIQKIIKNDVSYKLFNILLKRLFNGNCYNDNYKISNPVILNNNAIMGFEDLIIHCTTGGSLYALTESPYMLIIYNNLDFDYGLIPNEQNLYTLTRNIFIYVYSIIKRLIVEIDNGNKLFDDRYNDIAKKQEFINESIKYAYMVSDKDFNQHEIDRFNDIKSQGNLYHFATSICQFMDYDFICDQYCQILNNEYSLIDNENDYKRFMQNFYNNRNDDIARYNSYCKNIDTIENYLNSIINNCAQNIDTNNDDIKKIKEKISSAQKIEHSEFPTKVNDNSGIVTFIEKVNERRRQHIEQTQKQLKEIFSDVADETTQIAQEILNNNSNEISKDDNIMIVNAINKMSEAVVNKLNEISRNIYIMKDIMINTNNMILEMRNSSINNNNVDQKEIIKEEETIDNLTINKDINNEDINNKDNDVTYILDLTNGQNVDDDSDYVDGVNINDLKIDEDELFKQSLLPIRREDFIDFLKNDKSEILHVVRDLNLCDEVVEEEEIIDNDQTIIDNIPKEKLDSIYNMDNMPEADYDEYYYVPKSYLLEVIPYCGYIENKNNNDNIKDINFRKIDLNKAKKQHVPIYNIDYEKLMIPINNIPIIFNQKIEYIKNDISERIGLVDNTLANKIIKVIDNINIMKEWDSDIMFRSRIYTIQSLFNILKSNKLMKINE